MRLISLSLKEGVGRANDETKRKMKEKMAKERKGKKRKERGSHIQHTLKFGLCI